MIVKSITPNIEFRELSKEQSDAIVEPLIKKIFGSHVTAHPKKFLSETELIEVDTLAQNMSQVPTFRFGLFEGEKCIGWHLGDQESAHIYYMRNSAILPEYRRQGLYSKIVKFVVGEMVSRGFQVIKSNHIATNNPVIIAKLKLGFVIRGLLLSDVMGTLVELAYYKNETRKEILDFRAGLSYPSAETLQKLNLQKIETSQS